MSQLELYAAKAFDGKAFGELYLPGQIGSPEILTLTKQLKTAGITAYPGMNEATERPLLRLRYDGSPEALGAAIQRAMPEQQFSLIEKESSIPEPPNDGFVGFVHQHAPVLYRFAGQITGGFYFTAATSLLFSGLDDAKKAEKKRQEQEDETSSGLQKPYWLTWRVTSALTFMVSSSIIGLFVRPPKTTRSIHEVFQDLDAERGDAAQVKADLEEKPGLGTRVKENLRRFPWEIAALVNLPANFQLLMSTFSEENREKPYWWTQSLVSITMLANSLIRIITPQKGSTSIIGKIPLLSGMAEAIEERTDALEALRDNPINVTANISLAGKAGTYISGWLTGDKKYGMSGPLEAAGSLFAKLTNKALGIGFDETVAIATDYVEQWHEPGLTEEEKITWVARKLSRQGEIVLWDSDLVAGIRTQLEGRRAILAYIEQDEAQSSHPVALEPDSPAPTQQHLREAARDTGAPLADQDIETGHTATLRDMAPVKEPAIVTA